MKKIDLKDVTFMIPLKIDSPQRYTNFSYILKYLNHYFDTNIMVVEADTNPKCEELVESYPGIMYQFIELEENEPFHRTRYLNHMIMYAPTEIVVNYDADVLLPQESYVKARDNIKYSNMDLVYPYKEGEYKFNLELEKMSKDQLSCFIEEFPIKIQPEFCTKGKAEFGFCQFFNRQSYIDGGIENEDFISWGPEDYERYWRFGKLGFQVGRCGNYVFHLDHPQTKDSGNSNPHYQQNTAICQLISMLSPSQCFYYLLNRDYIRDKINENLNLFSWAKDIVDTDEDGVQFINLKNNWINSLKERYEKNYPGTPLE